MSALRKRKEFIVVLVALLIFGTVSGLSIASITDQAGNARVVNYMGIVRGATQRLVKEELYGQRDDALIQRLDGIIDGLITGEGSNDLVALPDAAFQDNMALIRDSWASLKEQIYIVRDGGDTRELYDQSQDYFDLANDTVFKAEEYSEARVTQSRAILTVVNAVALLLFMAVIIYFIRMARIQRKADQLRTLAYIDPLTDLPNRLRCEDMCKFYDAQRPEDNIGVFMFDMNYLKEVNDRFGHQAGDKLIRAFAQRLAEWAQSREGFVGRYGGDEFLAIIVNTDEQGARQHLEDLQSSVNAYNEEQPSDYDRINYAAGFTINNANIEPMEIMVIDADRAMYERKRQMKSAELRI